MLKSSRVIWATKGHHDIIQCIEYPIGWLLQIINVSNHSFWVVMPKNKHMQSWLYRTCDWLQERHTAEYCLFFFLSFYSYQVKTLHSRSEELAVPYQPYTATLKRPFHPVIWLDKHKCTSFKSTLEEGWQSLWQCCTMASDSSVQVFTLERVIPTWLGRPYLRLDSAWQGGTIIIFWGRTTLVPVEYPEVG